MNSSSASVTVSSAVLPLPPADSLPPTPEEPPESEAPPELDVPPVSDASAPPVALPPGLPVALPPLAPSSGVASSLSTGGDVASHAQPARHNSATTISKLAERLISSPRPRLPLRSCVFDRTRSSSRPLGWRDHRTRSRGRRRPPRAPHHPPPLPPRLGNALGSRRSMLPAPCSHPPRRLDSFR